MAYVLSRCRRRRCDAPRRITAGCTVNRGPTNLSIDKELTLRCRDALCVAAQLDDTLQRRAEKIEPAPASDESGHTARHRRRCRGTKTQHGGARPTPWPSPRPGRCSRRTADVQVGRRPPLAARSGLDIGGATWTIPGTPEGLAFDRPRIRLRSDGRLAVKPAAMAASAHYLGSRCSQYGAYSP